jgi:hypothetical protein
LSFEVSVPFAFGFGSHPLNRPAMTSSSCARKRIAEIGGPLDVT